MLSTCAALATPTLLRGVTLHLLLENERQPIADVPAVYFVQPSQANVKRVSTDLGNALYEAYHLNFSSSLPRQLLAGSAVHRPLDRLFVTICSRSTLPGTR